MRRSTAFALCSRSRTSGRPSSGRACRARKLAAQRFIWTSALPIRNLPVMKLELDAGALRQPAALRGIFAQTMRAAASLYGRESSPPFALALSGMPYLSYDAVQLVAECISSTYTACFPESRVLVVICEHDVAKALGQSLQRRCGPSPRVVCLDQIQARHGDYVDLGEPIAGMMIPVVVKTLAFHDRSEVTGV
nr:ethanolamine ammonia-lyase reactivating factor EutA [Paenibacillus sp. VKM B-2647]